jgi:hypothetical protein
MTPHPLLLLLRALAEQNVSQVELDAKSLRVRFRAENQHKQFDFHWYEIAAGWSCNIFTDLGTVCHGPHPTPLAGLLACRAFVADPEFAATLDQILLAYNRHEDAASSTTTEGDR